MNELRKTIGDSAWFQEARFGMFIHWGLYSLAARHEWVMHNEEMSIEEYHRRYFSRFDPDLYDPRQWADAAVAAGMKYVVIGTKHHEGFCLWDSQLTDYKAPHTPARRDLLRPLIAALRERQIRIGLYYSLIDWHHPQYTIDPHIGPRRNLPPPEREALNAARDQNKYAQYLQGQVRELLTNFGHIDILWFDYSFTHLGPGGKGRADWHSVELVQLVRQLQPQVLLNDRLDLPEAWDINTPEQIQPQRWVHVNGQPVVWEACQTFSGSWGYHRDEQTWRSSEELIRTLIDTVSKGGNLLLNVGPTARGEFDARAQARLADIGSWMRRHGRSIHHCTQAPDGIPTPQDCRLTYNAHTHRLYVHIFAWKYKYLHLEGLAERVEYAQLLNDASEIKMGLTPWQTEHADVAPNTLSLTLPPLKPDAAVPVIELFLRP